MSVLTDNIDLLLRMKGVGKYQFYKAVGISAAGYGKWVRGAIPQRKNLERVAEYLGVDVATLLTQSYTISAEPQKKEKAVTPEDDGKEPDQDVLNALARQIDRVSLRFALYGDPADDVTDEELQAVKDYAQFLRNKKRHENA